MIGVFRLHGQHQQGYNEIFTMLETGLGAPDNGMRRNYPFKPVMDRQTDQQTKCFWFVTKF